MFITEFMICSVLMGLGIGIDAAVATGARMPLMHSRRVVVAWLFGITLTHTLFPMAGYSLSYLGLLQAPVLSPLVGILAFTLIACFLWAELRPLDDNNRPGSQSLLAGAGLLLAVSWDALWSGPAKSAQVIGWPQPAVWASFIVVGAVVAILSWLALKLAARVEQLANQPLLQCLQYGVIAYFGWLALFRYTLGITLAWPWILLFALLVTALMVKWARAADRSDSAGIYPGRV